MGEVAGAGAVGATAGPIRSVSEALNAVGKFQDTGRHARAAWGWAKKGSSVTAAGGGFVAKRFVLLSIRLPCRLWAVADAATFLYRLRDDC